MGWELGPFTRRGTVLRPSLELWWASKDLFNPGAVVHDGRVHLLVRGEDRTERYAGVSRLGVATSGDGLAFEVEAEPVLGPADDEWARWEEGGGCEDPRLVEHPDGGYVCLYTGFNGRVPTLMVATSDDVRTWTKHGPAFGGTAYADRASKSGAVVTEVRDGRLVASAVDGTFWMYWGEGTCFAATSEDLVHWTPVEHDATATHHLEWTDDGWAVHHEPGQDVLRPLLLPRTGRYDARLVEPGPPAVRTADGIVLLCNGADAGRTYRAGQVLFDPEDPRAPIARATEPFLTPESDDERSGQVDQVCFAEGLVLLDGTWFLYYGMADSRIGCATAPAVSGGPGT